MCVYTHDVLAKFLLQSLFLFRVLVSFPDFNDLCKLKLKNISVPLNSSQASLLFLFSDVAAQCYHAFDYIASIYSQPASFMKFHFLL